MDSKQEPCGFLFPGGRLPLGECTLRTRPANGGRIWLSRQEREQFAKLDWFVLRESAQVLTAVYG